MIDVSKYLQTQGQNSNKRYNINEFTNNDSSLFDNAVMEEDDVALSIKEEMAIFNRENTIPMYSLKIDQYKPVLEVQDILHVGYSKGGTEEIVYDLIGDLEYHKQFTEHLYVMLVNIQNEFIGFAELSHGSQILTTTPIRELLIITLLSGANRIYLIHNHPGVSAELSSDDINTVGFVKMALTHLDIELIDSIVISSNGTWNSYQLIMGMDNE